MTTNIGDNPQQPGVSADAYIPDQLIAGNMKLVTDSVTISGAAALVRGSVMGQRTVGAAGAAVAGGGNTGNGVFSAIAPQGRAKPGVYTIRFTGATTYNVVNPFGVELTPGYAAGAYVDPEINWIFAAGGTAMVAGDTATITIAAGDNAYLLATSAAVDGTQNPVAILADASDPSGGNVTGGIYLQGEFNGNALTFGTGITLAATKAALRPLGAFVKTSVSATDPT